MNISVVGLGKLGAPLAACLAAAGHGVIGVDAQPQPVAAINRGEAPVPENGLAELIAESRAGLTATHDITAAVLRTDATFVVVPTPSASSGGFKLDFVLAAVEQIGQALRGKESYHLVIIVSTVMPGATDASIRVTLERAAQRRMGAQLGLCYGPEFVALGSVIRDLQQPDFVLIGQSDGQAGSTLASIWRGMAKNTPTIVQTSFINAELAKLSVNAFVTMKISFANTLSQLCEGFAGGDVDAVTAAIGLDQRIGSRYLRGGLAYGGPCFPRDNRALAHAADRVGVRAHLALATDTVNEEQHQRLLELVLAHHQPGGRVCVLGLAYKPGTNVSECSAGAELVEALSARGVPVSVFDPGMLAAGQTDTSDFASSIEAAVSDAHIIVLATAWPEFRNLQLHDRTDGRSLVVIDCWRLLDRAMIPDSVTYVAFGRSPAPELPASSREVLAKA